MKNNKKGISAIVATVLIILITVAAVTIIWAAIIPMISNQLESGTVCLDAVSQVQLVDAGYTCMNLVTTAITTAIGDCVTTDAGACPTAAGTTSGITSAACTTLSTAHADCGLTGWTETMGVAAVGDNQNISLQIKHGAKDFTLADIQVLVSAEGSTIPFSLINTTTISPADIKLPGPNEEKVFVIDTSDIEGTVDKISIAPVVGIGNTQEACDVSATKTLIVC